MNHRDLGRVVGIASGLGVCALASDLILTQTFGENAGLLPYIIPYFAVGGLFAVVCAFRRWRVGLLAAFIFSFLPFGAYLMFAPSGLHWFGVFQWGYVASFICLGYPDRRTDQA